jgi:hypothetical protein
MPASPGSRSTADRNLRARGTNASWRFLTPCTFTSMPFADPATFEPVPLGNDERPPGRAMTPNDARQCTRFLARTMMSLAFANPLPSPALSVRADAQGTKCLVERARTKAPYRCRALPNHRLMERSDTIYRSEERTRHDWGESSGPNRRCANAPIGQALDRTNVPYSGTRRT